jgi:hypothetical protein
VFRNRPAPVVTGLFQSQPPLQQLNSSKQGRIAPGIAQRDCMIGCCGLAGRDWNRLGGVSRSKPRFIAEARMVRLLYADFRVLVSDELARCFLPRLESSL